MSKPMLVTMPFVLLLLDYWPLQRFSIEAGTSSGPTFAPGLGEGAVSAAGDRCGHRHGYCPEQRREYGISPLFLSRFQRSHFLSVLLRKKWLGLGTWRCFIPALTGGRWDAWREELPFLLTASALVVWQGRRRRYLVTGSLWYLVMLLPVSGLVAIGAHEVADRYTYLPGTGILWLAVWEQPSWSSAGSTAGKCSRVRPSWPWSPAGFRQ